MSLFKIAKWIFFITLLSLAYTHLQMRIIDLAYQKETRERRIRELVEYNGNMTYEILKLKSANFLGHRILKESSGMKFAGSDQVRMMKVPSSSSEEQTSVSPKSTDKKTSLLSFLSFDRL